MAKVGTPIPLIQEQLGHKRTEQTMAYARFHPDYPDIRVSNPTTSSVHLQGFTPTSVVSWKATNTAQSGPRGGRSGVLPLHTLTRVGAGPRHRPGSPVSTLFPLLIDLDPERVVVGLVFIIRYRQIKPPGVRWLERDR